MVKVGMMSNEIYAFGSQKELIDNLSKSIIKNLQEGIDKNGKASLVVSGGNTPKPLFEKLSIEKLPWEKVKIGLCDERWVPPRHKDSNEKMVKEYLLQNFAKKAEFIGMYQDTTILEAEDLCSKKLKQKLYPFDVLILGMGNDAHTASMFPNNEKLKLAFEQNLDKLCISIKSETAPHVRMSLTRKAILSAKNIYLHFEGIEKIALFEKAIKGNDIFEMPIRSILNQNDKKIKVYYS